MPDESDELIAELKTFGAEMVNVGDRYKKIQAAIANKRRGKYTAEDARAGEFRPGVRPAMGSRHRPAAGRRGIRDGGECPRSRGA